MKLGIFESVFPASSLQEQLTRVAQRGFTSVQFNLESAGLETVPEDVPRKTISNIRNSFEATGVEIAALAGTYNMIDSDLEKRELGLARLRNLIPYAAELDVPLVTLCTGTRDTLSMWRAHPDNDSQAAWSDLVTVMRPLLTTAERHGVMLGIEPEPANVISNARRAKRLIDELGSPALKVIADPANIIAGDRDRSPEDVLAEAFDLIGDRIALAHAKDLNADGEFCAAGTGIVPWNRYADLLRESGYSGSVVLHSLDENQVDAAVNVLRNAGIPS